MRLNQLVNVYVYESTDTKVDGEITKTWTYKNTFKLNKQQDVNELDKNNAGVVDYEKIKLRTQKDVDINKNDGISFSELEDGVIPPYKVSSHSIIGKTHLIVCDSHYGK